MECLISVTSVWSNVSFEACVSLLTFSPDDVSIGIRGVLKSPTRNFLGGPVVKSLPCNAWGVGSIPGWGTKIPCVVEQLSPFSVTSEPVLCS